MGAHPSAAPAAAVRPLRAPRNLAASGRWVPMRRVPQANEVTPAALRVKRNKAMRKLHIEAPAASGTLFSIEPALCGRKRPTDYRMYPTDDVTHRRAMRTFFADRPRQVTCATCLRIWNKLRRDRRA